MTSSSSSSSSVRQRSSRKVIPQRRLRRDPIQDWKAFQPNDIPTKGGINNMPLLFWNTLHSLEQEESAHNSTKKKKKKQQQQQLSILELGCGCGELSYSLAQKRGHVVTGIDVNEKAIQTAKQRGCDDDDDDDDDDVDVSAVGGDGGKMYFHVADVSSSTFSINDYVNEEEEEEEGEEEEEEESLIYYHYDFCILQLLLSIIGNNEKRINTLRNAYNALLCSSNGNDNDNGNGNGGILYLSCSGVSDDINPNYKKLYEQKDDSNVLINDGYGPYSYYSRAQVGKNNNNNNNNESKGNDNNIGNASENDNKNESDDNASENDNKNESDDNDNDNDNNILYITHHFTIIELESLLNDVGFCNIRIEQHKETSSRRPNEVAYFLYATATTT